MKEIIVHSKKYGDKIFLVDDEDFELVSKFKWMVSYNPKTRYFIATTRFQPNETPIFMHRLIMNVTDPKIQIDHKNHNAQDNRKENLRTCTHAQNNFNRPINRANSSGYKGVCWSKIMRKWHVQIKKNHKIYHCGYYDSPEQAARVYDEKAEELFGEFAWLNFPIKRRGPLFLVWPERDTACPQ